MRDSSRRFTFSSAVWLIVLVVPALLLLLCYLSMYVNPARFWPAGVLAVMEFPVAIINLLLLVMAVIRRSRFFWIPLLALVPFVFIADKQIRFSGGGDTVVGEGENTLKIITYNVGGFRLPQSDEWGNVPDVREAALDSISKCSPDLVCMQEFYAGSPDTLSVLMEKYFSGYCYKYYFKHEPGKYSGNLTVSRFPIISSGVEKFSQSSNLALYNDIDLGNRILRVYNCHLQSYSISTAGLVKSMVEDKEVARETGVKVRGALLKRPKQAGQILDNVKNSPNEALICGDFNDTPMSYTYNALVKGRKDTFSEAGSGFAATYSKLWPLLRIDYIFVPESFGVISHRTPHWKFSDHYPVISVLNY